MNEQLKRVLERQKYRVVGEREHSGVKICHWAGQSLKRGRPCYKQLFYGIRSHRCLQMTPAVDDCTQMCLFCWRFQGFTGGREDHGWDDPRAILDGCISAHRKLLTGFGGNPNVDPGAFKEAQEPTQVACSLSGEPTLYPHLGELLEECHRRGMTTFLVTNGTRPDVLRDLRPLPTQLYVSVVAPDRATHGRLCAPLEPGAWDRLMETIDLLPSLGTRKVVRHTLVQGHNMGHVEEYAALDARADPDFIEPKGYVFVGDSRRRMTLENMPSHDAIAEFAGRLATLTGYEVRGEQRASRVVLLARPGMGSTRIPGLQAD
jgi:tRNA wybutosine-synthesizing protein 1